MPVVHLLPGGKISLLRISRVVKAGVIVQPGNGSRTRALDCVRKNCSALRLDNVQRRHLRAALRHAVGNVPAVVRWLKPVESDGSVSGKLVGVNKNTIGPVQAIAYIKDRLVLHALALG